MDDVTSSNSYINMHLAFTVKLYSQKMAIPEVLWGFTKEATDFSDLLQGRNYPFVIGS